MYLMLLATAERTTSFFYESWPIIKQLIWLFGKFMSGIMHVLDNMGVYNIALCIVIFTVITKLLLTPFTVKQQKTSRINSYIQPEIQAIQKKYQGRTDTMSQQKMLEEQKAVQEKYGTSTMAGCLPMLLQFPILFALYPVIYNMDKYVDYLAVLKEKLSATQLSDMYMLLGINLESNPGFKWPAIIIPILVAVSQFATTKLSMAKQPGQKDNPMNSSMQVMNVFMPLMLAFFSLRMPAFLGVYWIVQSVVMSISQLIINNIIYKKTVEEMIAENVAKANKKRAKKGLPPIGEKANMSTRSLNSAPKAAPAIKEGMSEEEKAEALKKSTEYYQSKSAKPGSLAAKANMVRDYNERTSKKN